TSFTSLFTPTATTDIYTVSLHDALPIYRRGGRPRARPPGRLPARRRVRPRQGRAAVVRPDHQAAPAAPLHREVRGRGGVGAEPRPASRGGGAGWHGAGAARRPGDLPAGHAGSSNPGRLVCSYIARSSAAVRGGRAPSRPRAGELGMKLRRLHLTFVASYLTVLAVAMLAAGPGAAAQGGEGEAVDGAQVFQSICAACHQPDGQGLPGAFPPLVGHAREL